MTIGKCCKPRKEKFFALQHPSSTEYLQLSDVEVNESKQERTDELQEIVVEITRKSFEMRRKIPVEAIGEYDRVDKELRHCL
uniref:Uncharacterized protein n=1 Tax=Glossina palpalis gambiensis TaxID=67801 RepID=A0A1B0AWG6_9MUSC